MTAAVWATALVGIAGILAGAYTARGQRLHAERLASQSFFQARRGNAYAEITHNARGDVAELWPLFPDRMIPRRRDEPPYALYPWEGVSKAEVEGWIIEEGIGRVERHGEPMPGAREAVAFVKEMGSGVSRQ